MSNRGVPAALLGGYSKKLLRNECCPGMLEKSRRGRVGGKSDVMSNTTPSDDANSLLLQLSTAAAKYLPRSSPAIRISKPLSYKRPYPTN